jgi:hypothetical protein
MARLVDKIRSWRVTFKSIVSFRVVISFVYRFSDRSHSMEVLGKNQHDTA